MTTEELVAALTLPGADTSRHRAGAQGSRRFSIALFLPMAAMALLLPLGGYLYVSGQVTGVWQPFGPSGIGIPLAAIPGLVLLAVLVLLLPRNMRKARQLSDDYLSGICLSISATPTVILLPRIGTDGIGAHVVGPTTMEGQRHGRHVIVQANATNTAVLVQVPTEEFEVTARGGRLNLASGPRWLSVSSIAEDPRWDRMTLSGSPAGVIARRKGSGIDAEWMLDLWLAELLLAQRPSNTT